MPDNFNPSRVIRSRRTEFTASRDEGQPPRISGYFVVFNQPYFVSDDEEEIIMPCALDNADQSDVRALTDHLTHLVLGRNTVQTLTYRIDEVGVYGDILVNEADTDAMNLYARVQRGDVDQASFGFDESDVRYVTLQDGRVQRQIWGISKLWELSVCTFPAYEQTSVSARSREPAEDRASRLAAWKESMKRRLRHHAENPGA